MWTWTNANPLDDTISPAWGDEVKNAIKQLAADIYTTPTNAGDGSAQRTAPIENSLPVATGHANGNGTTGTTVTLPVGFSPASVDVYEVIGLSWQGDPGGNGNIWVEKTTSNFVIKHYGAKLGVRISYQIVRTSA
jgi:hypothetical protein